MECYFTRKFRIDINEQNIKPNSNLSDKKLKDDKVLYLETKKVLNV